MADKNPRSSLETHEVTNQPEARGDVIWAVSFGDTQDILDRLEP